MKFASHRERIADTTAPITKGTARDVTGRIGTSADAATRPTKAIESTCSPTSKALKFLKAFLHPLHFTTC